MGSGSEDMSVGFIDGENVPPARDAVAGEAVHMLGWGPLCAFLILLSNVNCSKNKVFFFLIQ